MVLASNTSSSGGSYSSMRLIYMIYADANKIVREMTQLLSKYKKGNTSTSKTEAVPQDTNKSSQVKSSSL